MRDDTKRTKIKRLLFTFFYLNNRLVCLRWFWSRPVICGDGEKGGFMLERFSFDARYRRRFSRVQWA